MTETQRLRLYPASQEQMEALIAAQNDEALRAAYTEMLEGSMTHPAQREWYALWMIETKDGTHIGELCFRGLDESGAAEIGYGILEAYRGQRYAQEAVQAMLKWAFRHPETERIEAETEENNAASRRVLEKCGFVLTGHCGEEGPRYVRTRRCWLIFAGGPENGTPCLPVPDHGYVICADSGLRLCERLHIAPDLVLGDFDSLGAVPEQYPHLTVPAEKDDTDTLLAVRCALEKGFEDIRIYGAFGGRLDHTLANIQTLEFCHEHGVRGVLIGSENYVYLQGKGTRRYSRTDGFSFSVLAWSARCTGVTLTGVYYPLENGTLTRGFPLGVSNRITAESADVTCGDGLLLIIGSRL